MENVGMAHPETTSTIDFYSRKRALEAQLGHELTKDEAAEIMREGGHLKDARQANRDRLAERRGGGKHGNAQRPDAAQGEV